MIKIYICHQYYDKSHFNALYSCAEKNGYQIADYIVLGKKHIITRMGKQILLEHKLYEALCECVASFMKINKLKKLENEILIVGLAPYDFLMNKYKKVFSRNKSIYFTSWQFWDGSFFPRGSITNKEEFENILKQSFKGAACVTKVTERQVSEFIPKTSVVNHSIQVDSYKKKDVNSIKKINGKYLYLGRFEEVKNIDYILKYFHDNKEACISVDFAGDGSLSKRLKNAALSDKRIRVLGRLSKNEIKEKLCFYDYLLLPSREEPFGIVLIEALAAGVPCIVSDALGPNEIIGHKHDGFVFSLKDGFKGFKQVMDESMSISSSKYCFLCRNCMEEAGKYTVDNIFAKWSDLLVSLL